MLNAVDMNAFSVAVVVVVLCFVLLLGFVWCGLGCVLRW